MHPTPPVLALSEAQNRIILRVWAIPTVSNSGMLELQASLPTVRTPEISKHSPCWSSIELSYNACSRSAFSMFPTPIYERLPLVKASTRPRPTAVCASRLGGRSCGVSRVAHCQSQQSVNWTASVYWVRGNAKGNEINRPSSAGMGGLAGITDDVNRLRVPF